ncbi:MAG: hypothetical protein CMK50_02590 [Propionibacteriaceae bacterium]|nr:hypothetical protein [Propionibacteriaceae bacterium]
MSLRSIDATRCVARLKQDALVLGPSKLQTLAAVESVRKTFGPRILIWLDVLGPCQATQGKGNKRRGRFCQSQSPETPREGSAARPEG